jgi:Tol biopolymer transport system component
MKRNRRTLFLIAGLALLVAVAAAIGLVLARDGDGGHRLGGRIAVQDGCGLRHMWPDGTDRRRMCLSDVWAAVSLSWNGKHLAWDTGSDRGILVGNADGGDGQTVPVPKGANFDPSLSPDGDEVAFLHSPRDDGRYDVWVGSTSIDNAEQLTNTRNVSAVAWSPTGDWIAYVKGWTPEALEGRIALVRPNGKAGRELVAGDAPDWAPSGKEVAYVHDGGIWTIGTDGAGARLVVRDGHAPAWSRDGRQIAFMRAEKCGKPVCRERVHLVFVEGGDAPAVGPTFPDASRVLWLPDPNE